MTEYMPTFSSGWDTLRYHICRWTVPSWVGIGWMSRYSSSSLSCMANTRWSWKAGMDWVALYPHYLLLQQPDITWPFALTGPMDHQGTLWLAVVVLTFRGTYLLISGQWVAFLFGSVHGKTDMLKAIYLQQHSWCWRCTYSSPMCYCMLERWWYSSAYRILQIGNWTQFAWITSTSYICPMAPAMPNGSKVGSGQICIIG